MNITASGLFIPINYSTKNPKCPGFLALYFALKPEKLDKSAVDCSKKTEQLYRKNNIYGDHQFLIPVTRDSWSSNFPIGSMQIGNNPTTSVRHEKLQLMPCSQSNLGLICQLQSQPFYIEIAKRSFYLHVLLQGKYCKIPSQKLVPKNWFGATNHPVVTLATDSCPVHFSNLGDIPWSDIAQQLSSPEARQWGNKPLICKYS